MKQKNPRQEKTDEQKEQDAELAERAKAQGTSLLSGYFTKYIRKDDCVPAMVEAVQRLFTGLVFHQVMSRTVQKSALVQQDVNCHSLRCSSRF